MPEPSADSNEPDEPADEYIGETDGGAETGPETSRRAILAAVGAGVVTGVGASTGTFVTGVSGTRSETTENRRYFECDRVRIGSHEFPDDVQAEIDEALETGSVESDGPPLLPETMNVEESYVVSDGVWYTPVVDHTDDGTYVLTLEEVENPTLPEPRTLRIRNRSEEERTLTVRIEDQDGDDVLFEETDTVRAGARRTIWETDVIGRYDFTVETDDGQGVEDEVAVSESAHTSLRISPDGELNVLQAMAGIPECRFRAEDYPEPWVDVALESDRLRPSDRTNAELQLAFTEVGLSEYDLEVSVADPDVAQITDAQYDDPFEAATDPEIASDGSSVTLQAVDPDEDVPTEEVTVPLATIELEAVGSWFDGDEAEDEATVETSVEVAVESMTDDDGSAVEASGERATLTVASEEDESVGVGIDQYTYSRDGRGAIQGGRDSPQVTIGADAVAVHGSSTMGPSVCGREELTELSFDEESRELSVTVSGPNDPDYQADCTDDVAHVSYELVATLEDGVAETVRLTERAYAQSGTLEVDRDDASPAVSGVDDYEFTLVDDRDRHDAENDPEVTLEDGAIVVSGTIELQIACETVEPALIAYDEGWGRLVVEVTDTSAEGFDPGDGCDDLAGDQGYELRVPVDADSLSRVSAVEATLGGTRLVSVTGSELEEDASEIELNGTTPQDLDGDGLYRDVDGNGALGTNDVVTFFEHLEEPAVTENVEAFDFAGTNEISTTDVVELFESL